MCERVGNFMRFLIDNFTTLFGLTVKLAARAGVAGVTPL